MSTENWHRISDTLDALYLLEDMLDDDGALTSHEQEFLRRLKRRWNLDTVRKINRELERGAA